MIASARFGDGDAHWYTLHDLGEVSGGVVRRQQGELRSRRAAQAGDLAFTRAVVGINLEFDALSDANRRELRLLEVGGDPNAGIGDEAEQRLAGRNELTDLDLLPRDFTRSRRGD